jgi:hypothetical protein
MSLLAYQEKKTVEWLVFISDAQFTNLAKGLKGVKWSVILVFSEIAW